MVPYSPYDYKPMNRLRAGERFMFASGGTLNIVVHIERNLLVYTNILTGKTRRAKLIVYYKEDQGVHKNIWSLKYIKSLDSMFEKYYQDRREVEEMPF